MSNGDRHEIREIRAVYKTNMIRKELGVSYRTDYGSANMLDSKGQPINYTNPTTR